MSVLISSFHWIQFSVDHAGVHFLPTSARSTGEIRLILWVFSFSFSFTFSLVAVGIVLFSISTWPTTRVFAHCIKSERRAETQKTRTQRARMHTRQGKQAQKRKKERRMKKETNERKDTNALPLLSLSLVIAIIWLFNYLHGSRREEHEWERESFVQSELLPTKITTAVVSRKTIPILGMTKTINRHLSKRNSIRLRQQ